MSNHDTPLGWYKWYPRDFAMSSTVRKMSVTAKGIFRELLDLQWEDSGVPLTELEAMAIIHATKDEWEHFSPFFFVCFPNGKNEKLAIQREAAVKARIKQSESGKAGGKAAGKGRPKGKSGVSKASVRGTSNQTETETETIIDTKVSTQSGVLEGFDDPRKATTPFQKIERVLEIINGVKPKATDVTRHLKETQPLRRLVDELPPETVAELYRYASKNWKGVPTWNAIFEHRSSIQVKASNPATGLTGMTLAQEVFK